MISYSKKKSRKGALADTHQRISLRSQFLGCLWVLAGPTIVVNMALNIAFMEHLRPIAISDMNSPPWPQFVLQVVEMLLIGDFILYWGHRFQHMSETLWNKCHAYHHQLDTPTALSTIYIDNFDATLQGGLPLIIASAVLRPHPYVVYTFMALRVADNAVNHCGMNSKLINFLFLKYFPGRGAVGHHDYHHKYSNYSSNAKNFGEYFYVWDVLFG